MSKLFVIVISLYLIGVLAVGLHGEFPINDDWLFVRQVEHFTAGNLSINHQIDPSFILQGFMGAAWTNIFGFSFISLRVLTTIITVLMLYGVFKILQHLEVSAKLSFFILVLFAFNPIVFTSTFTFMTEAYFLLFFVWAIYFALRKNLLFFGVFCALSILVRQLGLFLVIPAIFTFFKDKRGLFIALIPILVSSVVWYLWPKYGVSNGPGLIEIKNLRERVLGLWMILPSLIFYLSPLLVGMVRDKRIWLVSLVAAPLIFSFDVLPLGSVFYVESLYSKTDFRTNTSVFDNTIFKLVLSYLVSVAFVSLLFELKRLWSNIFLKWTLLSFLGALIIAPDLYDRYLVIVFVVLVFMLLKKDIVISRLGYFCLGLLAIMSFAHNYEFMTMQRLKYEQVNKIQQLTGLKTQIYLDGLYEKYIKAVDSNDFQGLQSYRGGEDLCYVQEYTLGEAPAVLNFKSDSNPKVYNRRKLEIKRIKKHLDELLFNDEYFSIVYSTIGKRAFVGSWCDPEVLLNTLP